MNSFSNYNYPTNRKPWEEFKKFFLSKNILSRLIIVNVGVFIIVNILFAFLWLFNISHANISLFLSVPSDFSQLLYRPWTLITYMFYHEAIMHILFNMLWLYWFGRMFLQHLSEKQLLSVYLIGGLSGAFFYIVSFNIFPAFDAMVGSSIAMGASASVMAIVFAISFYRPEIVLNLIFIGRIKILYIALGTLVLDMLMISSGNSGGHLAHIGGAAFGYLFIFFLKRGNDISSIFRKFSLKNFFYKRKKSPFTDYYQNTSTLSDEEYNFSKQQNQEEIDIILEKISKSGYESLTKKEKEQLFKASKK